ncbi:hypothetical protein WJX72_003803 [[Myrmecia] bisecta]|uniref:CRAL-TRIO domain-containing protein n=1 Tax=[Myrmecia] bisecta TaxID=41462 RepID=A0AAW1PAT7_9CHLO
MDPCSTHAEERLVSTHCSADTKTGSLDARQSDHPSGTPSGTTPQVHNRDSDPVNSEPLVVQQARKLLHKRLKVCVKDGRELIGEFQCLDKQGNLILGNTFQQIRDPNSLPGQPPEERHMGQVLVPAAHRVSCELEDQQAVADLRDAVTDTLAGSAALRYWCTDHILKCFLQARNWNLSNATKMLRATLEWRQSYQPHAITWDDIREEARTKRQFILEPRDKEGRLVIVMRRRLQTSTDWAMGIKFLVYHLEVACRLADEEGTGKLTWLVDFEGSTRANSPPMKVALQTIHLMQNHYPERMGLALCYHAPLFFSCMWKAVRPFMDTVTINKAVCPFMDTITINKVCFAPDFKAGRQLLAEKLGL